MSDLDVSFFKSRGKVYITIVQHKSLLLLFSKNPQVSALHLRLGAR